MAAPAGLLWLAAATADESLLEQLRAAGGREARLRLLAGRSAATLVAALADAEKAGEARFRANDCAAAPAEYEIAVDLARAADASPKLPLFYRRIGICHDRLNQPEAALEAYRAGVAASEQYGDSEILAENLHGVVKTLREIGHIQEALPVSEREYRLEQHCAHADHLVRAMLSLAPTLNDLGRLREGLALYERAVAVSRESKFPLGLGIALVSLAMQTSDLGDNAAALRIVTELNGVKPKPDPGDLLAKGILLERANRDREAVAAYEAAVRLARDSGDWTVRIVARLDLGHFYRSHTQLAQARQTLELALAESRERKQVRFTAAIQAELSSVALELGQAQEAVERAREAVALARQSATREQLNESLCSLGRALEAQGHDSDAGQAYLEAIDTVEAMRADMPGYAPGLVARHERFLPAYQLAVRRLIRIGRLEEALRMSERAKSRVLGDLLASGDPAPEPALTAQQRAREGGGIL